MWTWVKLGIVIPGLVVASGSLAWIVLTDAPPETLLVVNEVEDADCTVTFHGGEPPWRFSVGAKQTTEKFFLFGIPTIVSTECRSARPIVPIVERHSESCTGSDRPYAITLTDEADREREFSILC